MKIEKSAKERLKLTSPHQKAMKVPNSLKTHQEIYYFYELNAEARYLLLMPLMPKSFRIMDIDKFEFSDNEDRWVNLKTNNLKFN